MIASLRGTLLEKTSGACVLEAGGVGYLVQVSSHTAAGLPAPGQPVFLRTRQIVREDALQLFGFADVVERDLFERMISVTGIGPRLAVGILSGATASRVRDAIETGDAEFLQTLPGVGKKLAQRLLVELREKMVPSAPASPPGAALPGALTNNVASDASIALQSLGFTRGGAQSAVQDALADLGANASAEAIIRRALQQKVR